MGNEPKFPVIPLDGNDVWVGIAQHPEALQVKERLASRDMASRLFEGQRNNPQRYEELVQ
jgi:hypothetical protein